MRIVVKLESFNFVLLYCFDDDGIYVLFGILSWTWPTIDFQNTHIVYPALLLYGCTGVYILWIIYTAVIYLFTHLWMYVFMEIIQLAIEIIFDYSFP